MIPHITLPSLELYADIEARLTYEGQAPSVTFGAKIKLHGQQNSISISPEGVVQAQSRGGILTQDPSGFGPWVQAHRDAWAGVAGTDIVTVFGEWAGGGIQRSQDAVCQLDQPHFFVFALGLGTMPHPRNPERTVPVRVITAPQTIEAMLPEIERLHVLPWASTYTFDYTDPAWVSDTLDRLNADVDALDLCDPYIQQTFGIAAPGEGYVLSAISLDEGLDGASYGRLSFKAKTERHRVRKQSKPAAPKEPAPEGADAFVETYVTPARCTQALHEACAGQFDKRHTGAFVAWMVADVAKESGRDVEAMNTRFETLRPLVQTAARTWYLGQCT